MNINKIVNGLKEFGVDTEALKGKLKNEIKEFVGNILAGTKQKVKDGVEGFRDSEYEDTTVKLLNKAINIPIVSEETEAKYIRRAIRLGVDNGKPYAHKGIDYAFGKAEEKANEEIDGLFEKRKG
tara:strand:+ start:51 stop:425 length:375 start_codon:yes stop_codon:yes gene_type:complete